VVCLKRLLIVISEYTVGTSMGALIGGLYAQEGDIITGAARAKQFGIRMSTFWRLATDLTWPVVAYTTVSVLPSSLALKWLTPIN
jgi:predicted acylesterase/phospholipase RssA